METWAWLIAYLLGFALLQLYLYRYFMGESATEPTTTPGFDGSGGVENTRTEVPDDAVACGECGTYNESHATFQFCKQCGARLS